MADIISKNGVTEPVPLGGSVVIPGEKKKPVRDKKSVPPGEPITANESVDSLDGLPPTRRGFITNESMDSLDGLPLTKSGFVTDSDPEGWLRYKGSSAAYSDAIIQEVRERQKRDARAAFRRAETRAYEEPQGGEGGAGEGDQQRLSDAEIDDMEDFHPVFTEYFKTHPYFANAVRGNEESVAVFPRILDYFTDMYLGLGLGVTQVREAWLGNKLFLGGTLTAEEEQELRDNELKGVEIHEDMARDAAGNLRSTVNPAYYPIVASTQFINMGGSLAFGLGGAAVGAFTGSPGGPVGSVANAVFLRTVGVAWWAFYLEAGHAMIQMRRKRELRGETVDIAELRPLVAFVGVGNAIAEIIGLKYIKKALPRSVRERIDKVGVKQAFHRLIGDEAATGRVLAAMRAWFTSMGVEGATEGVQEFTSIVAEEFDRLGMSDVAALMRSLVSNDTVSRILDSAFVGAKTAFVFGAAGPTSAAASNFRKPAPAQADLMTEGSSVLDSQTIQSINKWAEKNADLIQQNPEEFRAFVADQIKDKKVTQVLLDSVGVRKLLDDNEGGGGIEVVEVEGGSDTSMAGGRVVSTDEFGVTTVSENTEIVEFADLLEAAMPGFEQRLSEAAQAGETIAIPIEVYATQIAPHKALSDALVDHVKLREGRWTPAEQKLQLEAMAQLYSERGNAEENAQEAEEVLAEILQDLHAANTAGRSDDVLERDAKMALLLIQARAGMAGLSLRDAREQIVPRIEGVSTGAQQVETPVESADTPTPPAAKPAVAEETAPVPDVSVDTMPIADDFDGSERDVNFSEDEFRLAEARLAKHYADIDFFEEQYKAGKMTKEEFEEEKNERLNASHKVPKAKKEVERTRKNLERSRKARADRLEREAQQGESQGGYTERAEAAIEKRLAEVAAGEDRQNEAQAAQDQTVRDLIKQREAALSLVGSGTSLGPTGVPYTNSRRGSWNTDAEAVAEYLEETTAAERTEEVQQDYDDFIAAYEGDLNEAYDDARDMAPEILELEDAQSDAQQDAQDFVVDELEVWVGSLAGVTIIKDHQALSGSRYLTLQDEELIAIDVRFSDHAQVEGGGFIADEESGGERSGESDIDNVVKPDTVFDFDALTTEITELFAEEQERLSAPEESLPRDEEVVEAERGLARRSAILDARRAVEQRFQEVVDRHKVHDETLRALLDERGALTGHIKRVESNRRRVNRLIRDHVERTYSGELLVPPQRRLFQKEQLDAVVLERNDAGEILAPNGEVSNLNEFQAKVTRTPSFKAWFGDSKIVDENGEPKVVYHGTSNPKGAIFDSDNPPNRTGFSRFRTTSQMGAHFGTSGQANERINPSDDRPMLHPQARLIPVFIRLSNPLQTYDFGDFDIESARDYLVKGNYGPKNEDLAGEDPADEAERYPKPFTQDEFDAIYKQSSGEFEQDFSPIRRIQRALIERGYDGLVYENTEEGDFPEDSYVVFDGDQVVSATADSFGDQVVLFQNANEILERRTLMVDYGVNPFTKNSVRSVGAALAQRTVDTTGPTASDDYSDAAMDKLSTLLVEEVLYSRAASPSNTGKGWYSKAYNAAIDTLSEIHPELSTDPDARTIFTIIMAVTSNGEDVATNFGLALKVYSRYKKQKGRKKIGVLSFSGMNAKRVAGMTSALDTLNTVLQELGSISALSDWLLEEKRVSEFNKEHKERGFKTIGDWPADSVVPRSALMGGKIGLFWANLSGLEDYLTIDMWMMRTIGRYRGDILTHASGTETIDKQGNIVPAEKVAGKNIGIALWKETYLKAHLLNDPLIVEQHGTEFDPMSFSDEVALYYIHQDWASYKGRGYQDGVLGEKSANTIWKAHALDLKENPDSGAERVFIQNVVRQAASKLGADGIDLTVADIQAIIWYYEKRVYGELSGRASRDVSYEEAATDFLEDHYPKLAAKRERRNQRAEDQDQGSSAPGNVMLPTAPMITVGVSTYSDSIPGLKKLRDEMLAGDAAAGRLLQDIARDSIESLTTHIESIEIRYEDTIGLWGGEVEPGLQIGISFAEKDRKRTLAALARFGQNFNQQEVHITQEAAPGTSLGHAYAESAGGGYNTLVYTFGLNRELTLSEVQSIIDESGIPGLTIRDGKLETYYGEEKDGQKLQHYLGRVKELERTLERRGLAKGNAASGQGRQEELRHLTRIGVGSGATPYGDVPTSKRDLRAQTEVGNQLNPTAQRIAARLAASDVIATKLPKKLTKKQTAYQTRVAKAHEDLSDNALDTRPIVRAAYDALATELIQQYERLPVKVEITLEGKEPYPNSAAMQADVMTQNHLWVMRTTINTFGPKGVVYKNHPLLRDAGVQDINGVELTVNDVLRAVHDYYAHTMSRAEFGVIGEEAAFKNHMKMTVSPLARWALATETRGQNSWYNFGPHAANNNLKKKDRPKGWRPMYAPQKVDLLPPSMVFIGDAVLDGEIQDLFDNEQTAKQFAASSDIFSPEFRDITLHQSQPYRPPPPTRMKSRARELVANAQEKGDINYWRMLFKKATSFKKEELAFLGVLDYLEFMEQEGVTTLTKSQVLNEIVNSEIAVKTVTLKTVTLAASSQFEMDELASRNETLKLQEMYRNDNFHEVGQVTPEGGWADVTIERIDVTVFHNPGNPGITIQRVDSPNSQGEYMVAGSYHSGARWLTLPEAVAEVDEILNPGWRRGELSGPLTLRHEHLTIPGGRDYRENLYIWENAPKELDFIQAEHFEQANILVHTRTKIRDFVPGISVQRLRELDNPATAWLTDAAPTQGSDAPPITAVVLEEVQSGLHQQARDEGGFRKGTPEDARREQSVLIDQLTTVKTLLNQKVRDVKQILDKKIDSAIEDSRTQEKTVIDLSGYLDSGLPIHRSRIEIHRKPLTEFSSIGEWAAWVGEFRVTFKNPIEVKEVSIGFVDPSIKTGRPRHPLLSPFLFGQYMRQFYIDISENDEQFITVRRAVVKWLRNTEDGLLGLDDDGITRRTWEVLRTAANRLVKQNIPSLRARPELTVHPGAESADAIIRYSAERKSPGSDVIGMRHFPKLLKEREDLEARLGEIQRQLPPVPFKDTWHELGLKYTLMTAIREGHDAIAWAPAEVHVSRWETMLTEEVENVQWTLLPNNKYQIVPFFNKGVGQEQEVTAHELVATLGAETAKGILESDTGSGVVEGSDLRVSKPFMVNLYDRKMVKFIEKLSKRYGGRVELREDAQGESQWWYFEIPPAMRDMMIEDGLYLFQPGDQGSEASPGPRGSFDLSTGVIRLTDEADESTFSHELGHAYLALLQRSALGGERQAVEDIEIFAKWLGASNAADLVFRRGESQASHDAKVAFHEKFADAVLKYITEGEAPQADMEGIFQRAARGLLELYGRIRDEGERILGIRLTDEVRTAFDRMFQADAEVVAARTDLASVLPSNDFLKLTPEEYADLEGNFEAAQAQARSRLYLDTVKDANSSERAEQRKLMRQGFQDEVEAEVALRPEYQARRMMSGPDATFYMNSVEAAQIISGMPNPEEVHAKLSGLTRNPLAKHDIEVLVRIQTPDFIAEIMGIGSGEELIRLITDAPNQADAVRIELNRRVKAELAAQDERVELVDDTTPAAMKALHNTQMERYLIGVMAAMSKLTKRKRPFPAAWIESEADAILRTTKTLREIKPERFLRNERLSGARLVKYITDGDNEKAMVEAQRQLLNYYLYRGATGHVKRVKRELKGLKRLEKKDALKGVDSEFRATILAVLGNFDLRLTAPVRNARGQQLDEEGKAIDIRGFVEGLRTRDEIFNVVIEEDNILFDQPIPWHALTLDEFEELVDSIGNLKHLGLNTDRVMIRGELLNRNDVVPEMLRSLGKLKDLQVPFEPRANAFSNRMFAGRSMATMLRKIREVAVVLDGGDPNGYWTMNIIGSLDEANSREEAMQAAAGEKLAELMSVYESGELNEKVLIRPGLSVRREWLVAMALHTGSLENRQRLAELIAAKIIDPGQIGVRDSGDDSVAVDVQEIMDLIRPKDYDFAQSVGEFLHTFWRDTQGVEIRTSGVNPKKVEARPFEMHGKRYDGWYFPLVYDSMETVASSADSLVEQSKQTLIGIVRTAQARHQFTTKRVGSGDRILQMDLGPLYGHIEDVIHNITHREVLIGIWRVLHHPTLRGRMVEKMGKGGYEAWLSWLGRVAVGDAPARNFAEKLLAFLRRRVAVISLGLNLRTAMLQPVGLSNAVPLVGADVIGEGLKEYLGNRHRPREFRDAINLKSGFMANRFGSQQRDIRDARARQRKGDKIAAYENYMFAPIVMAQAIPDAIIWIGVYNAAVRNGLDEADSVLQADQAVIRSQGSGRISDVSPFEGGSEMQRLFSVFYSYFNTTLNLSVTELKLAGMSDKNAAMKMGQIINSGFWLVTVGALVPGFVFDLLGEDLPDEEEPLGFDWFKEWMSWATGHQLSYIAGMIPLYRDIHPDGFRHDGIAGLRFLGISAHGLEILKRESAALVDVDQANFWEEEDDWLDVLSSREMDTFIELMALPLPIPASAVKRFITGLDRIADDETEGVLDAAKGFVVYVNE